MPRLPPGPVSIALASLRNSVVLRLILHCLSIDDFWLISHEDESDGSSELLRRTGTSPLEKGRKVGV